MTSTSQNPDPRPLDRETMVVSAVVLLGAVMSIIDMTVINVALGRLAIDFHASFATIQWVITGYTLALAAVIPLTGWASDRYGTKRIYLASLVGFMVGSVLCAVAWSAGSLIAFRVLQGLGGGMIVPAVMTIIAKKAGPERRGRVMGVLGVPLLAAPILGPILGGWLVDDVSWRWIFLINVPIGIVAIALAMIVLDRDRPQPAHRLDWLGMALLSPGLTLLIFGFAESAGGGFGKIGCWLPIVAGTTLIAAFFWHSWHTEAALIDVKTFVHTRAGACAGIVFLLTAALFGALLLVPVYYQLVRGTSALQSGLLVAPEGLGTMMVMMPIGWRVDRHGANRLPLCGIPLLVIGFAPLVFLTESTPYWLLCSSSFVMGAGMGVALLPTMTAAIRALPSSAIARTTTAMNIVDQAGASVGAALFSILLAASISANTSVTGGFTALQGIGESRREALAGPMAAAFSSTFVWALVLIVLATVPALALAFGRPRVPTASAPERSASASGRRLGLIGRGRLLPHRHRPVRHRGEPRSRRDERHRPPTEL